MGFEDIDVNVTQHNLIFGELQEKDSFNFSKKVEVAARNSGFAFDEYEGGYEGFYQEYTDFFASRRRFSYTPMIWCRGTKAAG